MTADREQQTRERADRRKLAEDYLGERSPAKASITKLGLARALLAAEADLERLQQLALTDVAMRRGLEADLARMQADTEVCSEHAGDVLIGERCVVCDLRADLTMLREALEKIADPRGHSAWKPTFEDAVRAYARSVLARLDGKENEG